MFNTLIWATDGSATADRALPFVRTLAAPDAQVYAVHIREIFVGGAGAAYPVYADEPDLQERIAAQVAELRARRSGRAPSRARSRAHSRQHDLGPAARRRLPRSHRAAASSDGAGRARAGDDRHELSLRESRSIVPRER